jgi:hypothetical protein
MLPTQGFKKTIARVGPIPSLHGILARNSGVSNFFIHATENLYKYANLLQFVCAE